MKLNLDHTKVNRKTVYFVSSFDELNNLQIGLRLPTEVFVDHFVYENEMAKYRREYPEKRIIKEEFDFKRWLDPLNIFK